eukprot:CAMPEP_0119335806 /NCGR_PEP_ID=MMETSP1333-20130426/90423_1 /TAXON_ID=418940 /ORGANISM="Scyphosphaera apsteinii, Strain RCC1455" /LENGTH=82 /DNA_ID=CAMNT_0007346463 /DNA_START=8 /DNA_END=253 /DNA_ORIENTATION=-
MRHVKQLNLRHSWTEHPPTIFPLLADGIDPGDVEDGSDTPVAPSPEPIPPPDFGKLELTPEQLAVVQEQLAQQVSGVRAELE